MWRSKGRHFFFRFSITKPPSTKTQVPSKTLTLISSQSPKTSSRVFQTTTHSQNPRFFSHQPDPIDHAADKESDTIGDDSTNPSSISREPDGPSAVFGHRFEEDDALEKDPFPVSQESDDSPAVFDGGIENDAGFVAQELDDSSMNFGGGIEKNDDFVSVESTTSSVVFHDGTERIGNEDENPSFFVQENVDSSDQIGGFISEEQAEVTVAEVPEINIEQVENILSVLQSSLDRPLDSKLDEMGLTLSEEFAVRVIQTPHVLGENLIGFFSWVWKNPDFSMTSLVIDCLVQAISVGCRKKDVYALWDLVKEVGEKEKGLLSTEILNGLILMFWKLGKGKAGLEVFNKFDEFGCKHDADSYYLTIEALCRRLMFDDAWFVCEKMLSSGNLPESEKIGKIIAGLCKGSKAKDAHLIYLMAKDCKKFPPKSSVNFLIGKLCSDDGTVRLAAELLEDFSGEVRKYAIKPFTWVIHGLCRIQEVREAKKLLFKMIDSGPPPGNAVFNRVISGLSKAGEMEEAISLMKVMEGRGLRPDVYTYSVIMSGYANGGQMDDACRIFSEAKKMHSKLCPVTYHILIRGYCKMEEFDKALKYLGEMKEGGVNPNSDEYNKLIQSLCLKALDWRTANKLLDEMKENGLYLNGVTRGLIKAVKDLEEEELQVGGSSIEA
ncbi:small ribosomal subunit protein mS80 (rPPR6) [Magnolia sinica]|uniref:small ribosomal subunit protein mS80 (rPPR6) n=1 Tax=Magnolia sinica TaxID=86752 RepID=UPI002659629E|nr:small ribosomal subunit protein mS80 (rPPR6) [Magnolia sinica]